MKASEKKLLRFIEGSDKNFIIPVYQRNYDWQIQHCDQLFSDLLQIVTNKYGSYFLGSIVSIYSDNGCQEYLIIDGQQRLTTISILLLAIFNLVSLEQNPNIKVNKEQIRENYLVNKHAEESKRIRLKPIKNDEAAFKQLFSLNSEDYIQESNITRNYEFFINKLKSMTITIDQLYEAIQKLVIVDIELKQGEDDPQLIFESLNSTGLNLTQSDLVRNFILMKEKSEIQESYYENYWRKIEENTQFSVDSFIRDYLTYKERIIPKKDKVYVDFRAYIQKNNSKDTEEILKDLLQFSKYYKYIISSNHKNPRFQTYLLEINDLEISVSYPFLLQLFDDYEYGKISEDELIKCLQVIISYCFRRTICNLPTNVLNKIFSQIGKEIYKNLTPEKSYSSVFYRTLVSKSGIARFPDNDEFERNFIDKNFDSSKRKTILYLLSNLENFENKELVDLSEVSIEHIMPQTLSKEWVKDLGRNYAYVHSKYLGTIGNLTLTGYNSKLSNKSFEYKKKMKNGYKDSRLKLNKLINQFNTWGESSILERAGDLFQIAEKIWGYEKIQGLEEDNENILSIFDENDFTSTIVNYLVFDKEKIECGTWIDLTITVIKKLFDLDRNLMVGLSKDSSFGGKLLSNSPRNMKKSEKISDHIYLETHTNTKQKIDLLKRLLEKYGLDEDDLRVCISKRSINE